MHRNKSIEQIQFEKRELDAILVSVDSSHKHLIKRMIQIETVKLNTQRVREFLKLQMASCHAQMLYFESEKKSLDDELSKRSWDKTSGRHI